MGSDVVAVMDELGHAHFSVAGHDRGGRVAYRLALDHPGRIDRLALLDIIPTVAVWESIEAGSGTSPHWPMLAEPEPRPEQTIAADPTAFYLDLMRKWAKGGTLEAFDRRAIDHYRSGWGDPSRIHASCEDYRAGADQDRRADEADRDAGKTITCPLHLLASTDYLGTSAEAPLETWRRTFAPEATGTSIDAGHFIAEENPDATLAALNTFLTG